MKALLLRVWAFVRAFFGANSKRPAAAPAAPRPFFRSGQVYNLALDKNLIALKNDDPQRFKLIQGASRPNAGHLEPFLVDPSKPTPIEEAKLLYARTRCERARKKLASAERVLDIKRAAVKAAQAGFELAKVRKEEYPGNEGLAYEALQAGRRVWIATQDAIAAATLVQEAGEEFQRLADIVDRFNEAVNKTRTASEFDLLALRAEIDQLINELEVLHAFAPQPETGYVGDGSTARFEGQVPG